MKQDNEKEHNLPEYSVSELANSLKQIVEDRFGYVRVRGEIAGYRGPHASGHGYFALKDHNARLDAVIWRNSLSRMRIKPVDGLEIVASGRISTFPSKSSYQLIIDSIEPAGVGALMALLESRRRQLADEGLFEVGRKASLPFLPRRIGVVTSTSGAVIRDILQRLSERFPTRVIVWPVRVQGDGSGDEIAAAISGFNDLQDSLGIEIPDVLIVARGGGALEELWSFNEEIVVRAAARSKIPIISAIGHETDWTLLDHVADRRAPTPTAAAEFATPIRVELVTRIAQLDGRNLSAIGLRLRHDATALLSASRGMPSTRARRMALEQRFDAAAGDLTSKANTILMRLQMLFSETLRRSIAISPSALLSSATSRFNAATSVLSHAHAILTLFVTQKIKNITFVIEMYVSRQYRQHADNTFIATTSWNVGRIKYIQKLGGRRGGVDKYAALLLTHVGAHFVQRQSQVLFLTKMLLTLSYKGTLARGFALVQTSSGEIITRSGDARACKTIIVQFMDGAVPASVRRISRRPSEEHRITTEQKTLF